jgi:hypothetical protein
VKNAAEISSMYAGSEKGRASDLTQQPDKKRPREGKNRQMYTGIDNTREGSEKTRIKIK